MKMTMRKMIGDELTEREKEIVRRATSIAYEEGWWSWDWPRGNPSDPPDEQEVRALEEKLGIR